MEMLVVTGPISGNWEPIDSILGIGSSKAGWASGADIDKAFSDCKDVLRNRAAAIGGNAVINVDYEVRNFDNGIEVIAFGTAVRVY